MYEGNKKYKEIPSGNVIEELISRANRLRENVIKASSAPSHTVTTNRKNKHSMDTKMLMNTHDTDIHGNNSCEILIDDIDPTIDSETMYHMIGLKSSLKSTINVADSCHSILSDLDGLENEQSLLDDILYGGSTETDQNNKNKTHNISSISSISHYRQPHSKPPTGRSRSPSLTRVNGSRNRSSSRRRSQSLTRSIDSDVASRISMDLPNSDTDDSENGKTTSM